MVLLDAVHILSQSLFAAANSPVEIVYILLCFYLVGRAGSHSVLNKGK